jgi:hypothetical protein
VESLFQTQGALALLLIFFIPGFISLKVYDLLIPGERRDFAKSLFDAIAYSALNFGLLLPIVQFVRFEPTGWHWYIATFVLLVGMPVGWPVLFLRVWKIRWVASRVASPNSRVWDDIFARRVPYWVIVHLKDKRRIGGFYGGKSYTSHSPSPPEIYLEQVWHLDEKGFTGTPVKSTAGILILGDDIVALEFFEYEI